MSWPQEAVDAHYRRLREPAPDLTKDDPADYRAQLKESWPTGKPEKPAPKPAGRRPFPYVIESAPRTKKNSLRMMKRGGRMKPSSSAAYCAWHDRAEGQAYRIKAEIAATGIELPIASRVTVAAVFYQDRNNRADECGYMQALGDWLQDVGIVEDDYLIHWGGVEILVDRTQPRIEFGVTL